jgi:hypothetical protein
MSFRKPFRAKAVRLGSYARAKQKRIRRSREVRQVGMVAIIAVLVFVVGMTISNWKSISAKIPVFYPNCASARAAGVAPIRRGSPGYRSGLDADDDGIACEPYYGN